MSVYRWRLQNRNPQAPAHLFKLEGVYVIRDAPLSVCGEASRVRWYLSSICSPPTNPCEKCLRFQISLELSGEI